MRLSLLTIFAAALKLTLPVVAQQNQTSVTQLYIPFVDQQPLDASLINKHDNIATLAVQCAPDTPAEDCGLMSAITVTAGPSTFHFSGTGSYTILGVIDCKITGSTVADCAATQGVYDTASIATATDSDWITKPASTTITTSGVITGSEVTFVAVTITAGLDNTSGAAVSTSSGSGTVTKTSSGSVSSLTSSSSRTTTSASATNSAGQRLTVSDRILGFAVLLVSWIVMV